MDNEGMVITITATKEGFEIDVNKEEVSVKEVIDLLNSANSHILTLFYGLIGEKINSRNYQKMLKNVKINQILND